MTVAEREVKFLSQLRGELVDEFGDDLGETLFGMAAAEMLAGPHGVGAMFERFKGFQSKTSR